jgi:hypothetical protein
VIKKIIKQKTKFKSKNNIQASQSAAITLGKCCDMLIDDESSSLSKALNEALSRVSMVRAATQETFVCTPLECAPVLDVRCCVVGKHGPAGCVELKRSDVSRLVRRGQPAGPVSQSPFKAFADTWALRHHVQLGLQWLALRERFPQTKPGDCYVGYVSKDLLHNPTVELHRLNARVAKVLDDLSAQA